MASIDYSEICIGAPERVIDQVTRRIGQLNFGSRNIRIGVTDSPDYTFREQGGEARWMVMKLLYVTRSFVKARQMADLLRRYDVKLMIDPDQALEAGPYASNYYAFALVR